MPSFQLTQVPGGTLLAAETRVQATSASSKAMFAPYWLMIRLGGAGFIRIEIARRAEAEPRSHEATKA